MKTSLVLAGGGMRVAWQAGVVKALAEENLVFDHIDGTSGGILTAGMLLSGLDADTICRNWSGINVRDFGSALPPVEYLKGPWDLPALGDADGLLHKVFPALGIDLAAINASRTEGTFNVADFTRKQSIAFDAHGVDAELLAAGLSLPLFITPLRRHGHIYTDAVWIRDANVAEALRRGAGEIWLIWCIGNTGYWGDGPLEQYVHMIEMSAMGALLADFDIAAAAGRKFILHVVKPEHPLPLDPEFYLGRISPASLVAMGYRDARRYLRTRTAAGVPAHPDCTRMTEPAPGIRYSERLVGELDGAEIALTVTAVVPLPDASRPGTGTAELAGFIDHAPWGERTFLADGQVGFDGTTLSYRARLLHDGAWLSLRAERTLRDDPGWDAFSDADTVFLGIGDEAVPDRYAARLRLGFGGARRLLASVEPVGAHGLLSRADVIRRVLAQGLGSLYI